MSAAIAHSTGIDLDPPESYAEPLDPETYRLVLEAHSVGEVRCAFQLARKPPQRETAKPLRRPAVAAS